MISTKNLQVASKSGAVQQFKFAAGAAGKISGYGSVFGNIDQAGERVVRGAFAKSIARHKVDGTAPLLLWQHRPDEPIGRWTEFREDDYGLFLAGELTLGSSRGKDAYEHVKAGDVSGLSIGYRVLAERPSGEVTDLLELDLLETSVVSFPSNRAARISGVKFESVADIENLLLDAGAPRAFARKFAAAGWAAVIRGDETPTPTIDFNRLAESAERATGEIKSLMEKFR